MRHLQNERKAPILTNKVSAPPTMLSPNPVLPFSITIRVSWPGMTGQVKGSTEVPSVVGLEPGASVEDSPEREGKKKDVHLTK